MDYLYISCTKNLSPLCHKTMKRTQPTKNAECFACKKMRVMLASRKREKLRQKLKKEREQKERDNYWSNNKRKDEL